MFPEFMDPSVNKFVRLMDLDYYSKVYIQNFLRDYDAFLKEVNVYVPAMYVLRIWTCMSVEDFNGLRQGDCFFCDGRKMICVDNAFYQDEEETSMVEAELFGSSTTPSSFILCGDAYYRPKPWSIKPKDYVKALREANKIDGRKDKICLKPVLITKTSQPIS